VAIFDAKICINSYFSLCYLLKVYLANIDFPNKSYMFFISSLGLNYKAYLNRRIHPQWQRSSWDCFQCPYGNYKTLTPFFPWNYRLEYIESK